MNRIKNSAKVGQRGQYERWNNGNVIKTSCENTIGKAAQGKQHRCEHDDADEHPDTVDPEIAKKKRDTIVTISPTMIPRATPPVM